MLWNVKKVADYLGISTAMVYKMVYKNQLPFVRLSNCIRFWPETVESISKERFYDLSESSGKMPTANNDINFNSHSFF